MHLYELIYFIMHEAWAPKIPLEKNPLSWPMRGWLCWELIIPWKCHQPYIYAMYSSNSSLNKELTSSHL